MEGSCEAKVIIDYYRFPFSRVTFSLNVAYLDQNRKWPWRTVCKIDKEIMTLLHNVPTSTLSDENSIPEDVKQGISLLLRKRQAELQSVVIRIN